MKKINPLILFLIISINVDATATSNITIESNGIEICISENITHQVCTSENNLILDGTSDHILYFMPKIEVENNATNIEKIQWGLTTPLTLLMGSAIVMISLLSAVVIMILYKNVFK